MVGPDILMLLLILPRTSPVTLGKSLGPREVVGSIPFSIVHIVTSLGTLPRKIHTDL